MNYFEIFGLEQTFNIDLGQLSKHYLELQKSVHPDKFANGSEAEQRFAMQKAAQINDAFERLKSPIKRAEHLIELAGIELVDESKTIRDTAFLMQQMLWQEEIEDINSNHDEDSLYELQDTIAEQQAQMIKDVERLLANQSYLDAQAILPKLKFMAKLSEQLRTLEDDLID
ncbi:co-chaperone HscB [Paraferrimonas sp. SM1919]|uniref:co-chaperone HscB n=1 Tax=Paraferrimonas sp. SM1919 TaxID=2662263 RepID=UPI0013D19E9E|nr:co-chaperone HscB [Paraferrimonas sp. SM1919]